MRLPAALLAMALLGAGAAAAPAASLVRPIGRGPFDPNVTAAAARVWIPVAPIGRVRVRALTIDVVEVTTPGGRGSVARSAVTAFARPAGNGHGAAILLTLRTPAVRQPGQYTVDLAIRRASEAAPVQRMRTTVALPAAQMDAPATIHVERRLGLLGIGDSTPTESKLLIAERSRHSWLSPVTVTTVDGNGSGDLRFTDGQAVPPGRVRVVPYTLTGSFPLGTTSGVARIDAPQLDGFQTVSFEVSTRRATWTLLLAILLGLIAGYVVRVVLARRIRRGTAELTALAVRERIERTLHDNPDSDLHQALADPLATLDEQLRGNDEEQLESAAKEAARALTTALADLRTRRAQASEQLSRLSTTLVSPWQLPPDAGAALTAARQQLAETQPDARRNDVGRVQAALDRIERNLAAALLAAVPAFREDAGALVSACEPNSEHGAAKLDSAVTAAAAEARAKLDALADDALPDDAARLLPALDAAVRAVSALVVRLSVVVHQQVEGGLVGVQLMEHEDPRHNPEQSDLRVTVVERLEAFDETVRAALSTAAGPFQPIVTALDQLLEAFAALATHNRTAPQRRAAQRELAAGNLLHAVVLGPRTQRVGFVPTDGAKGTLANTAASLAAAPPADTGGLAFSFGPGSAPPPLDLSRVRVARRLGVARFTQTIILAVILSVIGVVLFQDSYVGSLRDVVTAFLWAFATDITVDHVLTALPAARPATA